MLSNGARSGSKNWRDNIVTTELTGNKLDEVEVVQTQANGVETRSDLGWVVQFPSLYCTPDEQQPAAVPQSPLLTLPVSSALL